jgi:hypothetical protein
MDGQHAIVFVFVNKETLICGYTWLIEWSTTSFYIKSQFPPLQSMKVSLHGPDPKHPGKQHLRFDFAGPDQIAKAVRAGGGWSIDGSDGPPFRFSGRFVNDYAAHIVRFSAEPDMFTGVPSAPHRRAGRKQRCRGESRRQRREKSLMSTSTSVWASRTGRMSNRLASETPA